MQADIRHDRRRTSHALISLWGPGSEMLSRGVLNVESPSLRRNESVCVARMSCGGGMLSPMELPRSAQNAPAVR